MGYTKEAIKGFSWIGAIRAITRILSFAKTLIIARILSPSQFGTFGIAILVLVFVEIFTETGINIFLVQKKDNIDKYISTSWIVSIVRGTFIALLIALSAPFVSKFFNSPQSYNLLLLVSIIPFLRGFINPAIVKFQKELIFNKEFYYRTSTFFIETFFAILFVLLFRTTESLIFGMIIGVIFEIVLSFIIIKPIPKISFNFSLFREVIGFGKWITASTIFNYFYQHGDDMAVGKILGTNSLGLYDMAYRISLVPITDIADVVTKVTFPVYVKISGDLKRLQKAFLKTLFFVLILVMPISLTFLFFPSKIVGFFLGDKWIQIIPVLQILAVFGFVRAISVFSSSIFLSMGKQNIVTLISFVGMMGLVITIIPFLSMWGIKGAALSALFGTTLTIPVIFYYWYKLIYKT